ncbi:MAG: hypothetical protein C7B44_11930 [Sulfobacillus thermosulfidooxidans]|nr:MAG: hypothetical protein C7B44_11930 [Sulfobacillus thermosulfidooxidans]
MGLFASPNSAAIMNSVPARYRGAASGMRSTFMNAGMMLSMGLFFTMVISGLNQKLPDAMRHGLQAFHLPATLVAGLSHLPPIAALFAALLGYNPIQTILPAAVLHSLPATSTQVLISREFFPHLIANPFMSALRTVFIFSAVISFIAAIASLLRGPQYIYSEDEVKTSLSPTDPLQRRYLAVALLGIYASRQKLKQDDSVEAQALLKRSLSLLMIATDPKRFAKNMSTHRTKGGSIAQ